MAKPDSGGDGWGTYDDDLVAGWAADALARQRAHAALGPNTEPLDEEDASVLAEWQRRCGDGGAA